MACSEHKHGYNIHVLSQTCYNYGLSVGPIIDQQELAIKQIK